MYSQALGDIALIIPLLPFLVKVGPTWFRRLVAEYIPIPAVQRLRAIIDTMENTTGEIYENHIRDIALEDSELDATKKSEGGLDIITSLRGFPFSYISERASSSLISSTVKANAKAPPNEQMSPKELKAQLSTILLGANETSTSPFRPRLISTVHSNTCSPEKIQARSVDSSTSSPSTQTSKTRSAKKFCKRKPTREETWDTKRSKG